MEPGCFQTPKHLRPCDVMTQEVKAPRMQMNAALLLCCWVTILKTSTPRFTTKCSPLQKELQVYFEPVCVAGPTFVRPNVREITVSLVYFPSLSWKQILMRPLTHVTFCFICLQPTCLLHVAQSQQDHDLCADGLRLPLTQSAVDSEAPSVAPARRSHACFHRRSYCTSEMEKTKSQQGLKAFQVGEVLSGF